MLVTARRSSDDSDNFLALRFVLMILMGVSFDGTNACNPTCLLLIVCITCC